MGLADLLRSGPITLDTPLAPGTLIFRALNGQERLGQPFFYRLEVTSDESDVTGEDLIGQPVAVHLELSTGEVRHIHALVTDFESGDTHNRHARYHATLRPWLWLLTQVRNCRIFQGKNVPDIVKTIFRDRGLTDFEERLLETYTPRELVVQYCESDFNFVSRLLEEEGIYYYFRHEEAKHVLVLADSQSSHQRDPNCPALPYFSPDDQSHNHQECVDVWAPVQHFKPDQFASKNYDFKNPRADLGANAQNSLYPFVTGFEVFEYPSVSLTKGDGESLARVRLEEIQSNARVISGQTNALGLLMGRLFALTDHPLSEQDGEYLITKATLSVRAPDLESGHADSGSSYECQFEAIPSATPFRALRSALKPFMRGPQTAKVVTAGSEDIWTDEYGRIRVKFEWDRFGATDEHASAWIRVAQLWAGSRWGAQFIPRVNMEVVVDFLEGDPDRPLVTGCVYNGDNKPPYDLGLSSTQSGIKTRSTKSGTPDNFNEIRFEDKKGEEELHVQAEKDYTELVKHDRATDIKHDRTVTVGHNDTLSITGDQLIHIHGNLSMTVDGVTDSNDKNASSPIKSSMAVTGAHDMKASDSISLSAPNKITLTVGGSSITITPGSITISAGGSQIALDANVLAASKAGSKIKIDGDITSNSSKGAMSRIDEHVLGLSAAGSKVVLDANAALISSADAIVNGTNVQVTGTAKTTVTGGASKVELAAAGATVSGPKVSVTGSALTEITGALVKIN